MEEFILYGKNEFSVVNNKIYYVYKINTKEKIEFAINEFNNFIDYKSKKYLAIDLEYNRFKHIQEVALIQFNLETSNKVAKIFVIEPKLFNNNNILIKLLTCKKCIRILHGGESLDIPYLFNKLLITKKNISDFCENLIDTKFLCDYINITSNIKKSCSIYNFLESNNIISNKKVKELENNEKSFGKPLYLIYINIHKLPQNILKYSIYDVIFLPQLIKLHNNKLISDLTKFVYKNKYNVDNTITHIKDIIMNYPVPTNNNYHKEFNNLLQINYFKKYIQYLISFSKIYNYKKISIPNTLKTYPYIYKLI